jgi:hypothetical protein
VDPQQQHLANMMTGMGAGIILFAVLFGLAVAIFFIFCFWRIFTKAGLAGPLALLVLFPGIGSLIVICILAFARWNVIPAPPQFGTLPPPYPPPYPPPPAPPATQL